MCLVVFLFYLVGLSSPSSLSAVAEDEACDYMFRSLAAVPHTGLTRVRGDHESVLDCVRQTGCEVRFVSDDKLIPDQSVLPDFRAPEGSDLYRSGWRANISYDADGPGTSLYGIEKGKALCLVSISQPAYVDEDGEIIQEEKITMIVQCRSRND